MKIVAEVHTTIEFVDEAAFRSYCAHMKTGTTPDFATDLIKSFDTGEPCPVKTEQPDWKVKATTTTTVGKVKDAAQD